ncbi:MFS transporter [Herbiconiux daphne]|uniref:MFS transporter n=1 Tax=Herbiconiux daphne TaxID=2970914 RepID=A0ABT2H1C0_9MICO|nr:MFS transporter [Herbiconiux daphne]MCS5733717.1 MFS transporter [Herbiconiux daphne]
MSDRMPPLRSRAAPPTGSSPRPLSAAQAGRRLTLLTATRWLPVGVVFGLTVLLPLERGIPLAQVGVLLSLQGFVVLGLELPTGGLADAIGRRPLLIASGILAVVSAGLMLVAESFWVFAVALVVQGVFRALDSGPLEAWYVDTAQAADPAAPIERALSRAGGVLGVAIAGGAVGGGALVAWQPLGSESALALPFAVALGLYAVHTVLLALLVREPSRDDRSGAGGADSLPVAGHLAAGGLAAGDPAAGVPLTALGRSALQRYPLRRRRFAERRRRLAAAPRGTVGSIGGGIRLLVSSPVLAALVLVEVFWSIAMVAFETLTPVQLADFVGGEDAAGALFGPASAAAWALFAAGSVLAGRAARTRLGVAGTAIIARVLNGLFVAGMGVALGPVGLIAGYWLAYFAHGAAGPMHSTLLHRQSSSSNRAIVLSINSMVAGGTFSIGVLVLAPLAEVTSTGLAIAAAGAFSVLGALLYLPALRAERRSAALVES